MNDDERPSDDATRPSHGEDETVGFGPPSGPKRPGPPPWKRPWESMNLAPLVGLSTGEPCRHQDCGGELVYRPPGPNCTKQESAYPICSRCRSTLEFPAQGSEQVDGRIPEQPFLGPNQTSVDGTSCKRTHCGGAIVRNYCDACTTPALVSLAFPFGTLRLRFGSSFRVDRMGQLLGEQLFYAYRNVSSPHCLIDFREQYAAIVDLKSKNGSFFQDEKITPYTPFKLGSNYGIELGVNRPAGGLKALQIKVTYE